jgi:hypothetical protein
MSFQSRSFAAESRKMGDEVPFYNQLCSRIRTQLAPNSEEHSDEVIAAPVEMDSKTETRFRSKERNEDDEEFSGFSNRDNDAEDLPDINFGVISAMKHDCALK